MEKQDNKTLVEKKILRAVKKYGKGLLKEMVEREADPKLIELIENWRDGKIK